MAHLTVIDIGDSRRCVENYEFIATDRETNWWWLNDILPIEHQDLWVKTHLFPGGNVTFNPWMKYVPRIIDGNEMLLEHFLLFPFLYQSLIKDKQLYFPATVWYPSPWFSTGQHKLAVWNLLERSFQFPILWQTPKNIQVQNTELLQTTDQLVSLIAPRIKNPVPGTKIWFHLKDGKMCNLTTSINNQNPWNTIKRQSKPTLIPLIRDIIHTNPTMPIDKLLMKICTIPVSLESL